jgi:hypothetical protein
MSFLDAATSIHLFTITCLPRLTYEMHPPQVSCLTAQAMTNLVIPCVVPKCLTPLPTPITITLPAEVAQLVEHLTENQGVTSSILVLGTGAENHPVWGGLDSRTISLGPQEPSSIDTRSVCRSSSMGHSSPSSAA